jgi:hypothetical protein
LVDAYINGNLYVNITRKYGQKYGTFTYLHVLDPEDLPLIINGILLPNILGKGIHAVWGQFFRGRVFGWLGPPFQDTPAWKKTLVEKFGQRSFF